MEKIKLHDLLRFCSILPTYYLPLTEWVSEQTLYGFGGRKVDIRYSFFHRFLGSAAIQVRNRDLRPHFGGNEIFA